MFATATTNDMNQTQPLHIDPSIKTIEIFLDLVAVHTPFIPNTVLKATMKLHELCDKYDCEKILRTITQRLYQYAGMDPMDVFILAYEK